MGSQPLPATVIESLQPGVLRATWSHPTLKAGALLVVAADRALLLIDRNVSKTVKLVGVKGCQVTAATTKAGYTVYRLKCSYNIAAKNLSGWSL